MSRKKINGQLEAYSAQETEGIIFWNLRTEHKGRLDIHGIENGDLLTIFADAARKKILWQGTVDLEFDSHRIPDQRLVDRWKTLPECAGTPLKELEEKASHQYAGTPYAQAVHGLQKGVDADTWFDFFWSGKPATLIPKR